MLVVREKKVKWPYTFKTSSGMEPVLRCDPCTLLCDDLATVSLGLVTNARPKR